MLSAADLHDLAVAIWERGDDCLARAAHFQEQDEPGRAEAEQVVAYGLFLVSQVLLGLAEMDAAE